LMIKTYVVMLSTDSSLTPSMLSERAATMGGVEVKETCYGLMLEGEEERLEEVVAELKKMDPNRIFYKVRGFRIGDPRICRAKRGGGPRQGYHMLAVEREALKNVSKALEAGELPVPKEVDTKKISTDDLRRLAEGGDGGERPKGRGAKGRVKANKKKGEVEA
jgi:putative methanogenesis marker protein 6